MEALNFAFDDAPKITRILTISFLSITLFIWFGLLTPLSIYLNYNAAFKKFEVWRLITNFFYLGDFGLLFVFHTILISRNSRLLEKNVFRGSAADYLYFIIIVMIMLLIVNWYFRSFFLSSSLSFAMTYYWGRKSKHVIVQFLGIISLRAPYLPWVYLFFGILFDSDISSDVMGLISGHIYFFFKDILPRIKGLNRVHIFKTPRWFVTVCEKMNLLNGAQEEVEEDLFF